MKLFSILITAFFLLFGKQVHAQSDNPNWADDQNKEWQIDQKTGLTADGGVWGILKAQIDDSSLPRVLMIGDSILIGYRSEAILRLKGKANVDCLCTYKHIGAGEDFYSQLRFALKQGPYTVIHFNDMGLHAFQKGRIPDGQYEPLLRKYIDTLKSSSPGVTLIWASCTPITVKGAPTQLDPANATIVERNAIAARVMQEYGIAIDDLYGLVINKLSLARGDQFHWTAEGQKIEGDQAAASIQSVLDAAKNNPQLQ